MDGIAWAASAMSAAQARLEIAAENLANGSSDGFRRSVARGSLQSSGVRVTSGRDEEQGALRHTGRQFDHAIVGRGTFVLRAPDGRIVETRSKKDHAPPANPTKRNAKIMVPKIWIGLGRVISSSSGSYDAVQ